MGESSLGDVDFDTWIGRERVVEDALTLERARKMAATLDLDPEAFAEGAPLPHGWHWIYFHEPVRRSSLGEDGHERRGDFLPPIPLERRMWAGGRLRFERAPSIGDRVRRVSTVRSVVHKEGRSGSLAFVTVEHVMRDERGVLIEEEQDLVYLNRARPDAAGSAETKAAGKDAGARESSEARSGGTGARTHGSIEAEPEWSATFTADEVTLFRFSALTFNGHRIHYDRRYAVEVEGYPDIVVHGPLLALLLLGAGVRWSEERSGRVGGDARLRFSYRALQPLFCNEVVTLNGMPAGRVAHADVVTDPEGASDAEPSDALELWAAHPERGTTTRAELERAP